jgi:hypothetical protein
MIGINDGVEIAPRDARDLKRTGYRFLCASGSASMQRSLMHLNANPRALRYQGDWNIRQGDEYRAIAGASSVSATRMSPVVR